MKGDLFVIFLFLLFSFSIAGSGFSGEEFPLCNPKVAPVKDNQKAYRLRGDKETKTLRCEGYYRSPVSRPSLDIVRVLQGRLPYSRQKNDALLISSLRRLQEPIRLRGLAIPNKMYYRLDANLPPQGKFVLNLKDIISPYGPGRNELGLYGILFPKRAAGIKKITYVPLLVIPLGAPLPQNPQTILTVRATRDISKFQWRIANAKKSQCKNFGDWKFSKRKRFRAYRPFSISLPQSSTGELCVEIQGEVKNQDLILKKEVHLLVERN